MAYYRNDPSTLSLSDGSAATDTNNAAPDAFDVVTANGGTILFQSKRWLASGDTSGKIARFEKTLDTAQLGVRVRLDQTNLAEVSGGTDTAVITLFSSGASGGGGVRLTRRSTGGYRAYDYVGAVIWDSNDTYPGDHEIEIRAASGNGTADGELRITLYPAGSNTPAEQFSSSSTNCGTTSFTIVRIGKVSSAPIWIARIVNMQINDASIAALSALTTSDSANAGLDQNNVEPFDIVTLVGTGSASGTWTQISGRAVTLNGSGPSRTFEAPGDVDSLTLSFRYTVGSASDNMTVTTLPANHFLLRSSGWKAMKRSIIE